MPEAKRQRGRPPKVIEPIPDTFENVVKALVAPVKEAKDGDQRRARETLNNPV